MVTFIGSVDKNNKYFLAAVDCTGHGVLGAFVSMLGQSLLYRAVNDKNISAPSLIIEDVHKGLRLALKQYEIFMHYCSQKGMNIA
ncbi:MAG: hypothetical protein H0V01_04780 [Bacteroidetes bacterium]|nr:hypothetical protein [Bacteroidota bacterium]HET6245953.1 hypothetical protein [Bacteroidia bacterium]